MSNHAIFQKSIAVCTRNENQHLSNNLFKTATTYDYISSTSRLGHEILNSMHCAFFSISQRFFYRPVFTLGELDVRNIADTTLTYLRETYNS